VKAGVLALQGAFREHREALDALDAEVVEVRLPEHLAALDVLFMPGGESTTIGKLLDSSGLFEAIHRLLEDGLPVFGTCAGMILLAREIVDGAPGQRVFDAVDIAVRRNGYGRQRESFEARLAVEGLAGGPFPGVFIRAPVVEEHGPGVDVLAEHEGYPVLLRRGRVWVSSFHPELSGDLRLHQRFLEDVSRI
jgi:5'-phosphate synthase pdxT subunit